MSQDTKNILIVFVTGVASGLFTLYIFNRYMVGNIQKKATKTDLAR